MELANELARHVCWVIVSLGLRELKMETCPPRKLVELLANQVDLELESQQCGR
jgi:hypothetical protein